MNTVAKPIFSVVMPMYNVERYVENAVASVLAQSYPHFELICVDDGCTDTTVSLVRKFNDSRVRIVHQTNHGLAAARNTGINHARGVYIAFLDSDDAWMPDKLQMHLRHFRVVPGLGISYSASQFIDEQGRDMGIGQYPQLDNITPAVVFCRNPIGNGSAPVIKHSLLLQVAETATTALGCRTVYFDESFRQSEDIEFWLRVTLKTNCVMAGIGEALTLYRVNSSGLSANLQKQFAAWERLVEKNRSLNPQFFERWYPMAKAYQKRYLARRAVQSRNAVAAVSLSLGALTTDWRILIREPGRTIATIGCAFLSVLPRHLYNELEHLGMKVSQQWRLWHQKTLA